MDSFAAIGKVYQNTTLSPRLPLIEAIVRRLPDLASGGAIGQIILLLGADLGYAINRADTATIAWIPTEERIQIINRLFDGERSDYDIAAIGKVYQNTPSSQRPAVRQVIVRRLPDLTMFQWARLHLLSGGEV